MIEQLNLAEPKLIGKHENGKDIYLKKWKCSVHIYNIEIDKEEIEEKPKKRKLKKQKMII